MSTQLPSPRIAQILVSSSPATPMESRESVRAVPGKGLEGDRYFEGIGTFSPHPQKPDFEITLVESEKIAEFAAQSGLEFTAAHARRNLVTEGVDLNALAGQKFRVGEVLLEGIRLCEPCQYLAKTTVPEVLKGLVHKAGLRARILSEGTIRQGDAVTVVVHVLALMLLLGVAWPRSASAQAAPATVRLSAPEHGSVYAAPATVLLQADTGTNPIPAKVEFYSGSDKLGESTIPPFSTSWADVPVGLYWLTAIATDAQGAISVSAPVEIAVTGPDCGSALPAASTNTVVDATDIGSVQIYFGQDVSQYQPFIGPNQVPRPADIPLSHRAADTFLARLPGVSTETFEGFAAGSVPTELTFGTNTVEVSGGQAIIEVDDPTSTNSGEFPISGTKGLELIGDIGTGFFALDFTTPQSAFGFYATDIELNGLNVTLVDTDGTNRVFTVPVTIPQGTAGALFWGVIDKADPFVHVELSRTGNLEDGFLFDNLTVAMPAQVWPEANWPVLAVSDAAPVVADASGTAAASFPVTLSRALDTAVTVEYATTNGTAVAGTDYVQTNGVFTFVAGETNAAVRVSVLKGDASVTNKSFGLELRNASGALLGRCQAQAEILEVAHTNPPPFNLSIQITTPPNETVFCPGTDIPIAASVQSSGTVTNVQFFEGTTLLGAVAAAPFTFLLDKSRVTPGDYSFTAKVTDDQGRTAVSGPVRVAVSDVCGDVAIVRPAPDPEIDKLVDYLFEIGLSARVFDRAGLTFQMLQPYQTIIWDDLGQAAAGADDAMASILQQAQQNGSALYFIGEQLAAFQSPTWTALTHLGSSSAAPCDGTIHVQASISPDPLLHGRFGTVDDFTVPTAPAAGQMTGTDAEVIGRCGERDVLIAYPGFEVVDVGQPRVFTQNLRVVTGTNLVSLAERKNLFENVICWLHHCECTTFDVSLQASGTPDQVQVGDAVTYTLLVSHTGECEATGAVLTDFVPAGMTFLSAESQQGSCVYDAVQRALVCNLGHLAKASTTPITVQLTAAAGGTWTNVASVRINGEVQTNNNYAAVVTTVTGSAAALRIGFDTGHQLQLRLDSGAGTTFGVQTSADLRNWLNWQTNVVGPSWSTPINPAGPSQFYRAVPR